MATYTLTAPADGGHCTSPAHGLAVTVLDGTPVCGPCMRARTDIRPDPHPGGINLDPESVRVEVVDAATHNSSYTPSQVAYAIGLSDETIAVAIRETVGDYFWAAFDATRTSVIDRLLSAEDAPDPEDENESREDDGDDEDEG